MKRSTVVRHLTEIAQEASRWTSLPASSFDIPPLRELWVGGDPVEDVEDVDQVVAILVLDVPATELPEIALHDVERSFEYPFRIGKRPMIWRSRPASRPAWSHLERRVARFWAAGSGADEATLEGLHSRRLAGVRVAEPTQDELRAWLARELPASEAHLRDTLDRYWDGDWRRRHTGGGIHPDDHLWRAGWAVQSMRDALAELG